MSLSVLPGPRKCIVPAKSCRGLFWVFLTVAPPLWLLYITFFHSRDLKTPRKVSPAVQPRWKRAATNAVAVAQGFTEELGKRSASNVPLVEQHALVTGQERRPQPLVPPATAIQPATSAKPATAAVSAPQNAKDATGAPQVKTSSVKQPAAPVAKKRFCDGATLASPCVFDIGLNSGQDTALYMREPNARVVAVEANPTLIEAAKHRFADALSADRLQLVSVGLTDKKPLPGAEYPTITFWVNTQDDKFGSFVEKLGCRSGAGKFNPSGDHSNCRRIDIPTRTCRDLVVQYGRPTYMKIDIEGMDRACFRSLGNLPLSDRPEYLSVENVFAWDIDELVGLGYKRFKMVNQMVLEDKARRDSSMRGNSGPWGDKAVDQFLGTGWHTAQEAKKRIPLPRTLTLPNGKVTRAWYDLHAAM